MDVLANSDRRSFFSRLHPAPTQIPVASLRDQFLQMLGAVVGVEGDETCRSSSPLSPDFVRRLNAKLPAKLKARLSHLDGGFTFNDDGSVSAAPSLSLHNLKAVMADVERLALTAPNLPALNALGRLGLDMGRLNVTTLQGGINGAYFFAARLVARVAGDADKVTPDVVLAELRRCHESEVLRFALEPSDRGYAFIGSVTANPEKAVAEIVRDVQAFIRAEKKVSPAQLEVRRFQCGLLLPADFRKLRADPTGTPVAVLSPLPGAMEAINAIFAQAARDVASGSAAAFDAEARQSSLLKFLPRDEKLARLVAAAFRAGLEDVLKGTLVASTLEEIVPILPEGVETPAEDELGREGVERHVSRKGPGRCTVEITETVRGVRAFALCGRRFHLRAGEVPRADDFVRRACTFEVGWRDDGVSAKCVFVAPPTLAFKLSARFAVTPDA